jgi:hypothetical protein
MGCRLNRTEEWEETIISTECNSPWEANSLLAGQETLLNLRNIKIYCYVHKCPLTILLQSTRWQHTLFSSFYYFRPFYNQAWSLRVLKSNLSFPFPFLAHFLHSCSSHFPQFERDNIYSRVKFKKLDITEISPEYSSFLPLNSKYFTQSPVLVHQPWLSYT